MTATLVDGETANLVWDALPIESVAETWGSEVYFGPQLRLLGRRMHAMYRK